MAGNIVDELAGHLTTKIERWEWVGGYFGNRFCQWNRDGVGGHTAGENAQSCAMITDDGTNVIVKNEVP